jgi:hypothetical protein
LRVIEAYNFASVIDANEDRSPSRVAEGNEVLDNPFWRGGIEFEVDRTPLSLGQQVFNPLRHHFPPLSRRDYMEALNCKSGVHATEVSRIEAGKRDPRVSTVERLAHAVNLRPGQLLE